MREGNQTLPPARMTGAPAPTRANSKHVTLKREFYSEQKEARPLRKAGFKTAALVRGRWSTGVRFGNGADGHRFPTLYPRRHDDSPSTITQP